VFYIIRLYHKVFCFHVRSRRDPKTDQKTDTRTSSHVSTSIYYSVLYYIIYYIYSLVYIYYLLLFIVHGFLLKIFHSVSVLFLIMSFAFICLYYTILRCSLVTIVLSCVLDDHSRVVLHSSDKPGSDYINANYIDVSEFHHIMCSCLYQAYQS